MSTELAKAESHTILPVDRVGDTLLVVPHGDLGGYSPQVFHNEFQRVQRLLDDTSIKNIVVDLGASRYFGSEMIGALVAMREKVIGRGRAALAEVSKDMRVGLDVIKADTLFEYFDNRGKALGDVASITVGERVHRNRHWLYWTTAVMVLAGVGVGLYVSKVSYQIFGSRPARVYDELARQWNHYEAASAEWAPEEATVYKEKLKEELTSILESLPRRRHVIFVEEDHWMREATSDFRDVIVYGEESDRESFFKNMSFAHFKIQERTNLKLRELDFPQEVRDIPPPRLQTEPGHQATPRLATDGNESAEETTGHLANPSRSPDSRSPDSEAADPVSVTEESRDDSQSREAGIEE